MLSTICLCWNTVIAASVEEIQSNLVEDHNLLSKLDQLISQAHDKSIPIPYQEVTRMVVENFLVYGKEDLEHGKLERAERVSEELKDISQKAIQELQEVINNPAKAQDVPLYKTSKVSIRDSALWGTREWTGSKKKDEGAVYFTGYGYFGQIRKDMEKFPAYGTNIVQLDNIEPADNMFPTETTINHQIFKDLKSVMERASKSNVAVDLVSVTVPLPEWLTRKYPHLLDCYSEYLRFDINAPESRAFLKKYLRLLFTSIKDQKSLFSYCLSNEPDYRESGKSIYTQRLWHAWLKKQHNTIQSLNKIYGIYAHNFDEIPIPTLGNERLYPPQLFYDWCIFNQERFIDYEKWQASIIHEIVPHLPLHIKIAPGITASYNPLVVGWGIDPELTTNIGSIAGTDIGTQYEEKGPWAENNFIRYFYWYDMLHSLSDKPLYNSENHIIPNNDPAYQPASHVRTILWQEAIHGVNATVIWFWERSYAEEAKNTKWEYPDYPAPQQMALESILTRPGCVEAVGHVNLDLNRLGNEVHALQQAPKRIAVLYSMPSFIYSGLKYFFPVYVSGLGRNGLGEVYDFADYYTAMDAMYKALMFTGERISFVSEKQIKEGKLNDYKVLIVPGASHVKSGTLSNIVKFANAGGTVILYGGNQCLIRDEYDRPLKRVALTQLQQVVDIPIDQKGQALRDSLLSILQNNKIAPSISVVDTSTNQPPWGVEWRVTEYNGKLLINLVNYTHEEKAVRLLFPKPSKEITNLFTGEPINTTLVLKSLDPILLSIRLGESNL